MGKPNSKEKKEFAKDIGERLSHYRKLRGLTLRELAAKTDYTGGYIGLIEKARVVPNSYVLKELSDALNIPISIIYGEKDITSNLKGIQDPIFSSEKNKKYLSITKEAITRGVTSEQMEKAIEFVANNL